MKKTFLILSFTFLFFFLFMPKNTFASNSTMVPNQMSFQTGSSSPVVVPVSSYTYSIFPYMTFYGYTSISDNLWNYAGWTFWSRKTGNYDLSFMYQGAWNTNSNDALSFSITQGSTVYPCTNTAISVQNGSANRSIISVFCPNVSLAAADFTINLEIPTSKLLTGSAIGITPLNLYEQGTTTIQKEVAKATEQIKQTNDILKDDNIDGSKDVAKGFFNSFESSNFGLSDVITMPLTFIKGLSNASCYSLDLPFPFVEQNVQIPCMTSIYENYFGSFLTLYQTITTGFIAYWVCVNIYRLVKNFKNPDDDKVEVMEL